jgi:negative modulator of initiation of replication
MKSIQIEDDLYYFIASQTQDIGESASDILRRLVMPKSLTVIKPDTRVDTDTLDYSTDNMNDNTTHISPPDKIAETVKSVDTPSSPSTPSTLSSSNTFKTFNSNDTNSGTNNNANLADSTNQLCQASAVLNELEAQRLQAIPKIVERWLLVLSTIHKHNAHRFSRVLSISGRNRTYFATDKDTLLATGSSTNPKNVPSSSYWVITNNNTVKKISMLKEVAEQVGFNLSEIERLITIFAPEHIQ